MVSVTFAMAASLLPRVMMMTAMGYRTARTMTMYHPKTAAGSKKTGINRAILLNFKANKKEQGQIPLLLFFVVVCLYKISYQ